MAFAKTHLLRRGNIWFFRMSVPRSLQSIFGKREIVVSLRTQDLALARQHSRLASNWLEALFNRMKIDPKSLTPQQLDQLVNAYFQHARQQHFETAGFTFEMQEQDQMEYLVNLQQELDYRKRQDLVMLYNEHQLMRLEELCHTYNIEPPEKDSPPFWQLMRGMNEVDCEITRMTIAKLSQQSTQAILPQGRFKGLLNAHGSGVHFPIAFDAPPLTPARASKTSISLKALLAEFVATKVANKEWSTKTVRDHQRNLTVFLNFMCQRHNSDDVAVGQIQLSDLRDYQTLLQKMPPHATKKFQGMTLEQIAELATKKKLPPMKSINVNKLLHLVRLMLDYAVDAKHLAESPYNPRIIRQKVKRVKADKYINFTKDDLEKLFSSQNFNRPTHFKKTGDWWIPLIALYTGARRGEIAMLEPAHITEVDGIKCIIIADTEVRRLKNDNSNRIVPIHPHLLELGLFDFAMKKQKLKSTFLFPDVVRKELPDPADAFGKRFTNLMKSIGIKKPKLVFHSFRHTFITQARLHGVPKDIRVMITGHEQEDAHDAYGDFPLKVLADNMQKISYEIDFDSILISSKK